MSRIFTQDLETPLGFVRITANDRAISSLVFLDDNKGEYQENGNSISADCALQLKEYFEGKRKRFSLPLILKGTEFQYKVWDTLKAIDFGETITYMDLAKQLNNPGAVRAVGSANGDNKIPILIPCHRVIGSDGGLTGYAGGLWRKQWLIEHEQKVLGKLLSLF